MPSHRFLFWIVSSALAIITSATARAESGPQANPPSFRLEVHAVLSKAGCNAGACHGNLNGKGGFRLSLRGEDANFDYASLTREAWNRRINLFEPNESLLIRKPTGATTHEGGLRFGADSLEAKLFRDWIAAGAVDDSGRSPKLIKLTVEPAERLIQAPSLTQPLKVTAEFSDGVKRDVTRLAAYDLSDPAKAEVTPDGVAIVKSPAEIVVAVRYLEGRAVSRLAFLADRPDFRWAGPEPKDAIDRHVFAKLESLKIQPSPLIEDALFLRRAFLDSIGVLPTVQESRSFLSSTDPRKRDRLIDDLTDRPEFADFWALKWADLLRNEEKTMGAKGVWVFQRWLRDGIDADRPLDEWARQLVTGTGSTWSNPPSAFHRTNRDPETAAESVAQVFLGVRLQCARCHNHPFDVWTQDDYYGLAANFSNVRRKEIANVRDDGLDKHEINGDVIIYRSGKPETVQPRTGETLPPKSPGGPVLGEDRTLENFADWLTRDNPQFVRNWANRVWFHLTGRGVVEPVDDFRESNPPSNPALLDELSSELRSNGMRLKPLVKRIMKSQVYQLSARPDPTNVNDEANFSHASVRLVPAEALLDAISQTLGSQPRLKARRLSKRDTDVAFPDSMRATQLPGARMGGEFLKVFGKPDRLLTCECERSDAVTLAQAFQLINGEAVRQMIEDPDNRIGQLLVSKQSAEVMLDELYLAALCRSPSQAERQGVLAYVQAAPDSRKAWEDVAWAIVNSKEFLLRN